MQELMVVYGNGGFVYYKTRAKDLKSAYKAYCTACERAGIDIDNLNPTEIVLRDLSHNDIARWKDKV